MRACRMVNCQSMVARRVALGFEGLYPVLQKRSLQKVVT
jgi:hypothetical protein